MDHELIDGKIIDKPKINLDEDQLIEELSKRNGLIPIDIDIDNGQLVWIDFGDYHFTEWELPVSVRCFINSEKNFFSFTTDLNILQNNKLFLDNKVPSGFIFHMSRCGSTVLTNSLSKTNNVITHSPVSFKFWKYITKNWTEPYTNIEDDRIAMYKNLLFSMGKKNKKTFFKFCSFETYFLPLVMELFPKKPFLFIFREPLEVLVSLLNYSPRWVRDRKSNFGLFFTDISPSEIKKINLLNYFEKILINILSTVLKTSNPNIHYLNYIRLKPQYIEEILKKAFTYHPTQNEIKKMQLQFKYYSKGKNLKHFIPDSEKKKKLVTPQIKICAENLLKDIYKKLEKSNNNILF